MNETQFQILMYFGNFVDENKLSEGIYSSYKPTLHPKDYTIEKMVETHEQFAELHGQEYFSKQSIENIKKCRMVPFTLVESYVQ
ncbi:MAG TPA: hypothetical protein VIK55_06780 [Paludibacter sp.]